MITAPPLSGLPPAHAFMSSHGDLLQQFGATKVQATDNFTIEMTYHNNSAAVNAEALLKDTIWGAKLVINNQSLTADAPVANAASMAKLLQGVAGLDVSTRTARCPGAPTTIVARTADEGFAKLVSELVEPQPAKGVNVLVQYANDVEQ